jgi:endonuclease YncB( thermonuclease family)
VIFSRTILGAPLALALSCSSWAGTPAEGVVVSVHDGDTLTVLVGKQEVKVRLAEIDAPEVGQPYG